MIVIKDFWASWCKPCAQLDKVLSEINDEYNNVSIKKFDIEDPINEKLVEQYSIRSVPTIIIEKNGILIQKAVGMQSKGFFTKILSQFQKQCDQPETGCDYNCMNCEIPSVEPEDCEYCLEESEEAGIEYEANFTHSSGTWTCTNCRGAV